jgi:hypothetical protein
MTVKAATNTVNCNTASDLNSIPAASSEQTADINVPSIDVLALANFALKELQAVHENCQPQRSSSGDADC